MQQQPFTIIADYFQFYLWDEVIGPVAPTEWDDDDVRRRIKAAPHVVVVCPVRNMPVPVEVQVHDAEPAYDASPWDHLAECSLELPTGKLQIHECTVGSVGRLAVAPGMYRVRVFDGGLDTLRDDALDGDDHYLVALWPDSPTQVRVIKQYP